MKGLPGTRVTGGFLVCTHNGDNVIQNKLNISLGI